MSGLAIPTFILFILVFNEEVRKSCEPIISEMSSEILLKEIAGARLKSP
jgi:hypothetical protein